MVSCAPPNPEPKSKLGATRSISSYMLIMRLLSVVRRILICFLGTLPGRNFRHHQASVSLDIHVQIRLRQGQSILAVTWFSNLRHVYANIGILRSGHSGIRPQSSSVHLIRRDSEHSDGLSLHFLIRRLAGSDLLECLRRDISSPYQLHMLCNYYVYTVGIPNSDRGNHAASSSKRGMGHICDLRRLLLYFVFLDSFLCPRNKRLRRW